MKRPLLLFWQRSRLLFVKFRKVAPPRRRKGLVSTGGLGTEEWAEEKPGHWCTGQIGGGGASSWEKHLQVFGTQSAEGPTAGGLSGNSLTNEPRPLKKKKAGLSVAATGVTSENQHLI